MTCVLSEIALHSLYSLAVTVDPFGGDVSELHCSKHIDLLVCCKCFLLLLFQNCKEKTSSKGLYVGVGTCVCMYNVCMCMYVCVDMQALKPALETACTCFHFYKQMKAHVNKGAAIPPVS